MKKLLIGLSLLTLAGSGTFAAAGNRPGAITFRLADGYVFFAQKRDLDNTTIPTIELGYTFNENWGAQIGTSVINTNINNSAIETGAHGFYYFLDGVYHMNALGNWQPYALGGVGITSLKVRNNNDPTNQANVNLGIGTQYFIADSIALGVDARDVYTLSGGKNDVMLTAGITFLMGGSASQPVVYKDAK
jgi:hypothetical protein